MTSKTELLKRAKRSLQPLWKYEHQCHVASLELVKSGIGDRVARGSCSGVGGQHSWVVIGDPYNPRFIIDPTLWSYRDDVKGIYAGSPNIYSHRPHGKGSIWDWGRPTSGGGPPITLRPRIPLSPSAISFLRLIGDLDLAGWMRLSSAPVEGWDAGEILSAMDDTPELQPFVPVDKLGMLTNKNPGGLYF